MPGGSEVKITHVPTREEVLEAFGKQGLDDLDDLAEAIVASARDAAEKDEKDGFIAISEGAWVRHVIWTATDESG
jgi:hypothetical protein